MNLILASASPYRRQQLESLGLHFAWEDSQVDESLLKQKTTDPYQLCAQLALAKAQAISKKHPDALVLGADQLVYAQQKILGKAGTRASAIDQLQSLQGQSHQLITSCCLIAPNQSLQHTDITTITLKKLTREQIVSYVDCDQTWDCAGSYKLEKNGVVLMQKISTEDPSAIIGLPLMTITQWLMDLGIHIPCLVKP